MKVSIIASVYNEDVVLKSFYKEMMNTLQIYDCNYELIFVNDGSVDNSQKIIDGICLENSSVKSILFSTNFGHEAAMIAGIDYATGDVIICMDSDLQHPPAMIIEMLRRFSEGDIEIINMVSKDSDNRKRSKLFYKTLNLISPYELAVNASDFFLISAKVAGILREDYRERVRFIRGFIQIIGFSKTTIEYEVADRAAGKSKYSIRQLLSLSVTAVATLSKLPLKTGIYMGMISALFSLFVAIYSIIMKFIDQPVSGYTTIIVFLGFMFSIQFFILGIMGEYIGFLFDEQKKRPIYIVAKTHNISKGQ